MICTIKNIPEESHPIYFKRSLIANANYLQFLDLRLQIKTSKEEGWEIEFEGQFYEINSYGVVGHWPAGLYEQHEYYYRELLRGIGK